MANKTIDDAYVIWLLSAAHSYLGQNMTSQAIILLELLNALQPENQQALRMLAYAYLLAARYQEVLEVVSVLAPMNPDDGEQTAFLNLLRSRALWSLGETEKSKAQFGKYIVSVASLKAHAPKPKNG